MLKYERNGRVYECDPNKLPAESVAYLLQYGWAQSLQDCIAGRAKKVREEYAAQNAEAAAKGDQEADSSEIEEAVESDLDGQLSKRMDSIIAGTMGQRESVSRDPFGSMCLRIAAEMLTKALKASKTKVERNSDKWKELLAQVNEKYADQITTEAKRRLDSAATIEIEI